MHQLGKVVIATRVEFYGKVQFMCKINPLVVVALPNRVLRSERALEGIPWRCQQAPEQKLADVFAAL